MEIIKYENHHNIKWLKDSIIFLTKHGSHAYGLNTPTSDLDIKGICVPPGKYFLGAFDVFEQAEGKNIELNAEYVVYDIRKFIKLAADCNPNIIEVLWTDDSDIIFNTPEGALLRAHKKDFLSSKARYTFAGYAMAQLKRIRTHRKWLLSPPQKPPTREELGLPPYQEISKADLDAAIDNISKKVDQWEINLDELNYAERIRVREHINTQLAEMQLSAQRQFQVAGLSLGYGSNIITILQAEKEYKNKVREYEQYLNWKATRNKDRAALEEKFGLDTKHASHLVRLLLMCEEILTLGEVIVKRPDRIKILGIRNGDVSFDEIIDWASEQEKKLDDLYLKTSLPRSCDINKLNDLCQQIVWIRLKKGERNV